MAEPRQIVVHTAQLWYDEAKAAALDGRHNDAFIFLMNAFNHTENALVAVLQTATLKDQPPVSGRPKMTLTEMRAELSALAQR